MKIKKSAFEILGDRIKNFFHVKKLEDNDNLNKVIDQFQKLYIPINEQLELEKKRSNSDIIKSLAALKQVLEKKKLDVKVNVPPAKIIVPKPLVKIMQESKEAEKMVKLLEAYLKLNLKFYQSKDGGTFITNREARDAVPVVLTDAGLKKFYNAISTAVSQSQDPFVNPAGHRRPANVDANGNLIVEVALGPIDVELDKDTDSISVWSNTAADGSGDPLQPLVDHDGHLQVDVLTMPPIEVDFPDTIDIGNFPTEYPLPDAQFDLLAKEAKQDDQITELQAIKNNTDGLEGFVDGVEALLGQIKDAVDGLEAVMADIDLNTDEIEAKLEDVKTKLDHANTFLDSLANEDFATETTLVLVKNAVDGLETLVAATNTLLTTIDGRVDGLETLITATNTKLDTIAGYVDQIEGYVDGIETLITSTNTKLDTLNSKDFATQTTLAAILAKIIASPATEATLAAILAKIIAAPATEAKQDTEISWLEAIYNIDYQLIRDDAMTASTPTNATIGTTSATVIASNASRKGLILTNISTGGQRIDLAFSGQTALLAKGVPLFVGGVYCMGRFDKTTGQVNAIATAAGAVIAIQELT